MARILLFLTALVAFSTAQQVVNPPNLGEFRISGTVVNAIGGEKLPGTKLRLAPTSNEQVIREYVTGEDGTFIFDKLPAAKYSLTASRRGFHEQGFDQHGDFWTGIAVGPNLQSTELVFRLKPDAQIVGRVTEDGDPISGGQVILFHRGTEEGLQTTRFVEFAPIDDQGSYRISHLLEGTYLLAVAAQPWYAQHQFAADFPPKGNQGVYVTTQTPPYSGNTRSFVTTNSQAENVDPKFDVVYPITFYQDATDPSAATAIVLRAGEKYEANVSLHTVHALRLRVHVPMQDPSRPHSISVSQSVLGQSDGLGAGMIMRWNSQGFYEIAGLAPGHFVVQLHENGGESHKEEIDLSGDADLDLSDSGSTAAVTGTVTYEGLDSAPENAFLIFRNQGSGHNLMVQVNKDGNLVFHELPGPGKYIIYPANTQSYIVERVSATGARAIGQLLEIKPGVPTHISISMSRQFGQLDGTAYFSGKPFGGAMIVLVPQDPKHNVALFRRDQSDSDGTFTLPAIVPGKYTLIALRDAWDIEWSNPATLSPFLRGGQEIEVAANEKNTAKVNVQSVR